MAYTTANQNLAYKPGSEYKEQHAQNVADQKAAIAENPNLGTAMSDAEMNGKYGHLAGGTLAGQTGGAVTSLGGYTKDAGAAEIAKQAGATVTPTTYKGESGWYQYSRTRPSAGSAVEQGRSGADEDNLSDLARAAVTYEQQMWDDAYIKYQQALNDGNAELAAQYKAEMEKAHENADRIRLAYGYQGGSDGSLYLTAGELGLAKETAPSGGSVGTGASGQPQGSKAPDLTALLEAWKQAAADQANGQIDYAVSQAITDLERALADAQPQFKEQAEAVAKDEMQALDNSALYAELRGDKGGIGQSQYNEIQAAAAQNRLSVQQAQTKLSTDTARQIADLRAQGEFEKADKALEISQQYLSQLINLEQWAAEFNLSAEQFNASLQQWQAEYDMAMQQFQVDTELSYAQLTGKLSDGTLTLSGQSQLAQSGEAMLSLGIMPTAEQLSAMGMTETQAQAYITAAQLEAASKGPTQTEWVSAYQQMFSSGVGQTDAYGWLVDHGYSATEAKELAAGYNNWKVANNKTGDETGDGLDWARAEIERMRANGATEDEMFHEMDSAEWGLTADQIAKLSEEYNL